MVPLTSEEAQQQAKAEGLTLQVAKTKSGYFGVAHRPGKPKPYEAQVWREGKTVSLGYFATAEEAALRVARSSEGKAAPALRVARSPDERQAAAARLSSKRVAPDTRAPQQRTSKRQGRGQKDPE